MFTIAAFPRRLVRTVLLSLVASYLYITFQLHAALLARSDASTAFPSQRESPQQALSRDLIPENQKQSTNLAVMNHADFAAPDATYVIDTQDLWESPEVILPLWMKNYFRWHKQTRQRLSSNRQYSQYRYMLWSCLPYYRKCGGTADRLLPLPFLLLLAAQSQRLLLIKWGRPAELEEFLLPPMHGMDWRVSDESLYAYMEQHNVKSAVQDVLVELAPQINVTTLMLRFQSNDHGATYYNQHRFSDQEPTFRYVFRDCWRVAFTPVPAIADHVKQYMRTNGLVPGQYAAAHLRALYNVKDRDPGAIREWTKAAIECLATMNQGSTSVYFASDSRYALEMAGEFGSEAGLLVSTRWSSLTSDGNPLHLDKADHWKDRPPSDFYDTFVDLYLLAGSDCVAHGMGGFGVFASYLSANASCAFRFHSAAGILSCPMHDSGMTAERIVADGFLDKFLLDPMPEPVKMQNLLKKETYGARTVKDNRLEEFPNPRKLKLNVSAQLWHYSEILPLWMKDYFQWHRQERSKITPETWQNHRYLVVACLQNDAKCGGTADRLRPMPFYVRVAAETSRLLFVVWEKPAPLEEFLLPPMGGLDWRTPDWMVNKVRRMASKAISVSTLVRAANNKNEVVVKARVQADDHGGNYYNAQGRLRGEPDDAFRQHYHDLWYVLFTPAPPLARAIEDEMEKLGLVPGEYAFAHLRANYGMENTISGRNPDLIKNWTINAINCISNLRPGGPFFFTSDSTVAQKEAVKYGNSRNTTVATRSDDKPPLHIDIGWQGHEVAEFYPVFIDLYLMSMGRCFSYNMGGFGKWGSYISGRNLTCNIRHWTKGVAQKYASRVGCNWTEGGWKNMNVGELEKPLFLEPMP